MSAFLTSMTPAFLASALTMAYPVPFGQPVAPESLPTPAGEIVDIDQDRAKRMTVPVSIEGNGPFSFVIDTGAERTVISRKVADNLALEGEEPAQLMSIAGISMVDMVYVPRLTLGQKNYDGLHSISAPMVYWASTVCRTSASCSILSQARLSSRMQMKRATGHRRAKSW